MVKMEEQLVKFRTTQINPLHRMFMEFEEIVKKSRISLDKAVPLVLEHLFLITLLEKQYRRLGDLDAQIDGIEKQLVAVARKNETCKRLLKIPGMGALIATAAVAKMGDPSAFKSG